MRRYITPCRLLFHFKQTPNTFYVEEVTTLTSAKRGRYAVVKVQKVGLSTWELLDILGRYTKQVSYAGLKDKHATTIQYLSFDSRDLPKVLSLKHPKVKIVEHFKSTVSLKIGELRGNRFRIWLEGVNGKQLEACMRRLAKEGVPNYFGYQRFGKDGLAKAKAFVEGDYYATGRVAKMLIGIYQAYLFNSWLAHRIELGFGFLKGDVVQKDSRLFVAYQEQGVVTGLLPGSKVVRAKGEARKIETLYDEPLPTRGQRRLALIYPQNIHIEPSKKGAWLSFFLPKGSYATIVLENLIGEELKGS